MLQYFCSSYTLPFLTLFYNLPLEAGWGKWSLATTFFAWQSLQSNLSSQVEKQAQASLQAIIYSTFLMDVYNIMQNPITLQCIGEILRTPTQNLSYILGSTLIYLAYPYANHMRGFLHTSTQNLSNIWESYCAGVHKMFPIINNI